MILPRLFLCATVFAAAALPAQAQQYPQRAVRLVVPYVPGGGTDFTARVIAPRLGEALGQQVVVENRPGGGTNIGSDLVAKAAPDGYTLLMAGAANAINMSLYAKLPYDTLRDFAPVSLSVKGANVLLVHPSLPAKNLKELLTLARAQPGRLNYASSGIGSANHMAGELLKLVARVNIAHVPYKGNAPALTDLIGGHVEVLISGVPAVLGQIRNGRVRAIAIASLKRFPALRDTPTIDESGLKGFEATTWFGVMAPAKTPREIVNRLNADLARIVATPEVRERFIGEGVEPVGGSTELFAAFVRDEIDKYGKVVRAASLTAD
jgi:tripartite-type tricarboxylate transporter receptor subunit TctC